MFTLFLAAYLLTAPTLMGIIVIGLLTAGMSSANYIIMAAVVGAVVAVPVAWLLSRKLEHLFDARRG
ncbi:CTP synthetase [Oricola nitratireducens]|uniref:CTP synthetase n=1 Tax=Oricola nitratireducens TaxID=2775868 RepID=UPI0018667937|nr:CTP synthetase [Oricola nitratireducens]